MSKQLLLVLPFLLAATAAHAEGAAASDSPALDAVGAATPAGASPTTPAGAATRVADGKARSPFAGKSRAWLLEERERVEAALPWEQWLAGGALLIPFGALGIFGGYLGSAGGVFGPHGSGPDAGTTAGIWVSGGAFILGGIVLCTVVTILRRLGEGRLEALGFALEAQWHQPMPREPKLEPHVELK